MTVEVPEVGAENGLEVASTEDEHAIKALTPEGADKPLRERIGPRRQPRLIPTIMCKLSV